MKARAGIIVLVLSLSICTAGCKNKDISSDKKDERSKVNTFAKYYEPYEVDIKPNAPCYKLPLDLNDIVNIRETSYLVEFNSISSLIRQNGFAIVEPEPNSPLVSFMNCDCVSIYRPLGWWDGVLPFVTTDTVLYLYHKQFEETLKDIEFHQFIPDINDLTIALLNDALQQYEQLGGEFKEAAKRNVAYLSVAQKLINPNATIPEMVGDIVLSELAKIKAHSRFKMSDIFKYREDYSQYMPRGHYTRNEALKRYFKTMMWYGRMAFLLKGGPEGLICEYDANIQTLQAFLLATSLKNVQVGERNGYNIWDRIYKVTSFYIGFAEDLTPSDYLLALDKVVGADFLLSDLADESNLFTLKEQLMSLPSPNIYGGTGDIMLAGPITNESLNEVLDKTKGMRLMGRRFVPDSYMFQNLVFPQVGSYLGHRKERPFTAGSDGSGGFCRAYVRGLDLMALLGSNEALNILTDEGDTNYQRYHLQFGKLKSHFDTMTPVQWNVNLYWSWLYSLKALIHELPDGYPAFMRTQAWQRRQLQTALASWTQLRHDTILYVKQSYTIPPARRLPTPPPGYVEPNPIFWGRLLSLTRMTLKGLDDLNVLTPEARRQFTELQELLQHILDIVAKQFANKPLSPKDHKFFKELPYMLDSIVSKTRGRGQSLGTTLVADVHTLPVEAKVVEEALGRRQGLPGRWACAQLL